MYLSEKAMATHSSTLAWKIPWTEELVKKKKIGVGGRLGWESHLKAGKAGYDGWEGSGAEDKALSISGLRRFWGERRSLPLRTAGHFKIPRVTITSNSKNQPLESPGRTDLERFDQLQCHCCLKKAAEHCRSGIPSSGHEIPMSNHTQDQPSHVLWRWGPAICIFCRFPGWLQHVANKKTLPVGGPETLLHLVDNSSPRCLVV